MEGTKSSERIYLKVYARTADQEFAMAKLGTPSTSQSTWDNYSSEPSNVPTPIPDTWDVPSSPDSSRGATYGNAPASAS